MTILPIVLIAIAGPNTMSLESLVAEVAAEQQDAGETVQKGASEEEIAEAAGQVRGELGAQLPADYLAFLAQANGMDFNGLVLYGAGQSPDKPGKGGFWQGLVATNQEWRSTGDHEGYLILGDTDMDLLTASIDGQEAALRDRVSGDVLERFGDVRSMLEKVLRDRLQ